MAAISLNELEELLALLDGVQKTRYLALASAVLLGYDYFLTLSQEIQYFWTGPWSASRVLFLFNRYFSQFVMMWSLLLLFVPQLTAEFCSKAIPAVFIMGYIGIAVVQAIIVLRIWYMFSNRPIARSFILAFFLATLITTIVLFKTIYADFRQVSPPVPGISNPGCSAPPSNRVWRIYLPNLILHTVLYLATTWPAFWMRRHGTRSPLMNRLLKDGGIFYVTVFASAAFTTIGALQHDPSVMVPALYANFLLSVSSVSVSRLMLSIRSLAAFLEIDSDLLLSDAELSRVQWRTGHRAGELIVEIEAVEAFDDEVLVVDANYSMHVRTHTPVLHATRVGVYEDEKMPGADKVSRVAWPTQVESKTGEVSKAPQLIVDAGQPFHLSYDFRNLDV